MTLLEITYELQSPLTEEQLRQLGQFANTYGLRSFHVNESKNQLSFEYDASRLRETQVEHVLAQARIAIARQVCWIDAGRPSWTRSRGPRRARVWAGFSMNQNAVEFRVSSRET